VRDYYLEVSNGKLDFQNEVYGYYRAKQPKSYYEGGSGYARAGELLDEMIAYFDPLVDFSKFDNDKDGKTEAVSIVYAGTGQTWGQGLWPHAGSINRKLDGVTVSRYMMTDLGTRFGLYVFAHECGHMIFGWPDLYYFGDYCLMGNRIMDQNPVAINDFYRADQGWIPAVDVDKNTSSGYSLSAGQGGFRYANPAKPGELFFWSNVKNTGRWSGLKGKGILLYHFDKGKATNASGTNRSLFVVEADGANNLAAAQWPSPGSSAADFFPYGNKLEFSQATTTASRWNDGSASGLRLHSIGPIGDVMTFAVGLGTVRLAVPPGGSAGSPEARNPPGLPWYDAKGAIHRGWTPRFRIVPGIQ
jgi:M6 family metalloprotease-like protein